MPKNEENNVANLNPQHQAQNPQMTVNQNELETFIRHTMATNIPEVLPAVLEGMGIKAPVKLTTAQKAKRVGAFLLVAAAGGVAGGLVVSRLERRRQRKEAEKAAAAESSPEAITNGRKPTPTRMSLGAN